MSSPTLKSSDLTIQDRRQEERRQALRIKVPQGVPLTAEIVTPNRVLRTVQCINLSSQGALLEFGEGKCPPLEKGTKLSIILKLAGEMATIPGVVRHRTESRMGMSFEREILAPGSQEEKSFANILGILERAVNRRSSALSKEESNPSAGLPGSEPAQKTGETPLTQTVTTYSSQDRRQQERRREPRIPILQGIPIRAEVVTPDRILRPVRCVDLSPHGALLDFGTGKCPPLNLDAQVLVNLQIGSDTANIPSLVRHRTNSRIGVEFPFDRQSHLQDQEKSLVSILRTLERAISRRRGR